VFGYQCITNMFVAGGHFLWKQTVSEVEAVGNNQSYTKRIRVF
jgi:hypothetical protein